VKEFLKYLKQWQIFGCPEKNTYDISSTILRLWKFSKRKISHLYVLIVPHENFPTIVFLEAANRKNSRFFVTFQNGEIFRTFL
jgi:hypothetical protein